ncbi:MAG: hypothetical protein DMG93_19105 [Acidobacteria bacterium]|jgi:hypothetical protein|nr:MAG: hypothetical protein DMG93_19105 [Acidobacteriota bacterium]
MAVADCLTFSHLRNSPNNTHWTNLDMALLKHFKITESMAFEFRAEAYNVFNHTQWWRCGRFRVRRREPGREQQYPELPV